MDPKPPEATQQPSPPTAQPTKNQTQPVLQVNPVSANQPTATPITTTSAELQPTPVDSQGTIPPSPPSQGVPPPSPIAKPLLSKKLMIIGGVLVALLLSLLLALSGGRSSNKQNATATNKPKTQADKSKPVVKAKDTSQTLVYGTWTSQQSVIRAVNTDSDKITTILSLPLTVKKVSVLSSNTLLYIDQIDRNEYGQRLSVYDLKQKQIVTNIPANPGLSIVDYVLSPNKQYLAIWEVSLNRDTHTLLGGQSSVYSVDLTRPSVVNPLYSEPVTTTPVHYPRGVLNDGTVFTDTYLPTNSQSDPGYENGLSVINVDGTNQRDITAVPIGTYGTKPVLSPDQKYLLFGGYDGANGDGTATRSGTRQAILTPDSIDILNTHSLKRFKLPNLPAGSVYAPPQWDMITGDPIITILASTSVQQGVYDYDLGKQKLTKFPFNPTSSSYISQLPGGQLLTGTQSTDKANLGNLGLTDDYAFTQLSVLPASASASIQYIGVQDPFIQYITLLPGNYFPTFHGKKQ
ncbi:MAG: hypothetical protein ACR2LN_03480 [Candidatus Levyibacteriota bacterium]